jgi:hypothetical protein
VKYDFFFHFPCSPALRLGQMACLLHSNTQKQILKAELESIGNSKVWVAHEFKGPAKKELKMSISPMEAFFRVLLLPLPYGRFIILYIFAYPTSDSHLELFSQTLSFPLQK